MNSKLEQTLHELYVHGYNTANRHKPKAQDIAVAEAEKAIRQAVGEEMLELANNCYEKSITDLEREAYQTKQEPVVISKTELRQKIKQWSKETTE